MVLGDVLAAGIKAAAKNGKKALKNGLKNGVNGVVNGNGIKNGLNGIDEIVSSTDTYLDVPNHGLNNYLKQARQSRNTFEKLKTAPPKSLEELTEWHSELEPGTREHLVDFGKAIKFLFPDKEGGEKFIDFPEIYSTYERLGFSRTIDGVQYRLQLSGKGYGPKNKYAGGPSVGSKTVAGRNANQKKSGAKRAKNIAKNGFSTDSDRANFNKLKQEVKEGNASIGRAGKTGTGGYILEHDILQNSRYWKVHTLKKNSDRHNVYVWYKPEWASFKGAVERHIRKIDGEPFAIKMNGTKDQIEIIHIDTDKVIGMLDISDDYEAVFKQLTEAYK